MKRWLLVLFLAMVVIQIATPLSMIAKREFVLKYGEEFKFKVAPVDPFDAFRGRYVAIRVENNWIPSRGHKLQYGQKVYALIGSNQEGLSFINGLSLEKPKGNSYIEAKVENLQKDSVQLDLPIDRYYMEERAAPHAERLFQSRGRNNKQDAYILVSIKDGFSVVKQLYLDGKRIEDVVKRKQVNP